MARPIEKKDYQDSDERVATFRITHGKLTAFQEVCAAKETSVSQALIGFIDSVIGGGDIPEKGSHVSLPENLATQDDISKAIAELQTNFENQLGEFKSLVFDTAPTLETMNAAIKAAIKSNSESGVTKELLETVTEGKPEKKTITEIMPSQDSPITLETDIQDVSPINQGKEPEKALSSLFPNGLTGQELSRRLRVDPGSITRNWKKGADHFAKWSREGQAIGTKGSKLPDPDNLAWEKRGDRYYPIINKD
jgi:hypothetical protein